MIEWMNDWIKLYFNIFNEWIDINSFNHQINEWLTDFSFQLSLCICCGCGFNSIHKRLKQSQYNSTEKNSVDSWHELSLLVKRLGCKKEELGCHWLLDIHFIRVTVDCWAVVVLVQRDLAYGTERSQLSHRHAYRVFKQILVIFSVVHRSFADWWDRRWMIRGHS